MDKINDGGPAFPRLAAITQSGAARTVGGMSLRDWFAGTIDPGPLEFDSPKAAADFIGSKVPKTDEEFMLLAAKMNAKLRYIIADAMLTERSKP